MIHNCRLICHFPITFGLIFKSSFDMVISLHSHANELIFIRMVEHQASFGNVAKGHLFSYSFPPVVSRGSFRPWRASKPKSTLIRVRGWIGGKISSQPHAIVKQICFPNSNVLFLSLFSLSKKWMHNVVWGCAEILPNEDTTCLVDPSICLSSHH